MRIVLGGDSVPRYYASLAALERAVKKSLTSTLKGEVSQVVEKVAKEKIKEDVYGVYSPSVYERRGELMNAEFAREVFEDADGVNLRIYSMARPNDSLSSPPVAYRGPDGQFAQWINDGNVPNIFNSKKYIWETPRPFYSDAENELDNTGLVLDALRAGMQKRGYETRG